MRNKFLALFSCLIFTVAILMLISIPRVAFADENQSDDFNKSIITLIWV